MPSTNGNDHPLQLSSLNWISLALELFQGMCQFLSGRPHEGIYEVLEYDAILELVDAKGKTSFLKKQQRVKFLQDNVIAFQDLVWGDGEVLADYDCSPGIAVDAYKNGDRWNVLISLRETRNTDDIVDLQIQLK